MAHLPVRVELGQTPFHPQERYQCGPAALATVLQASGAPAAPEELAGEIYLPGKKGSLQVELTAAARARDRIAYRLPASLPALLAQVAAGHPVLVMQNVGLRSLPAWHFAVLIGYDRDAQQLYLRSGTTRRLVLDADRFLRSWDRAQRWAIVVLPPDVLPAEPDVDRYMHAAASLEAVGRLDAAEQAYRRAREQWPQSPWPAVGLANVSYARGDQHGAEAGYRDALALDPQNVVAHNNLADILLARGCVAAARPHVERAAELAAGQGMEAAVAATKERLAAADAHDAEARCSEQRR